MKNNNIKLPGFELKSIVIKYITNLFLPPWVWVLGLWLFLTGFLFTFDLLNDNFNLNKNLYFSIYNENDIYTPYYIWVNLSLFLLINYTLGFIYLKRLPKLNILAMIFSILMLILSFIFYINLFANL